MSTRVLLFELGFYYVGLFAGYRLGRRR
jgi:hypothetical protein